MSTYTFRRLTLAEEAAGFAIAEQAVEWMHARAVNNWPRPFPRAPYAERQARGENHGLFRDDELVAIVSLGRVLPPEIEHWWRSWRLRRFPPLRRIADSLFRTRLKQPWVWLSTFAVSDNARGQGAGRKLLEEAECALFAGGTRFIYLECADALGGYYEAAGYRQCARQRLGRHWYRTFERRLTELATRPEAVTTA